MTIYQDHHADQILGGRPDPVGGLALATDQTIGSDTQIDCGCVLFARDIQKVSRRGPMVTSFPLAPVRWQYDEHESRLLREAEQLVQGQRGGVPLEKNLSFLAYIHISYFMSAKGHSALLLTLGLPCCFSIPSVAPRHGQAHSCSFGTFLWKGVVSGLPAQCHFRITRSFHTYPYPQKLYFSKNFGVM